VILLAASIGCAHGQHDGTELEAANNALARSIRWSDLTGLAHQIVPERQAEFLKLAGSSEDNLKVNDYEVEDVQVSGDKAVVRSRVSWYRQPSITNKTESMTVLWEQKGGTWWIVAIVGGPLPLPPLPAAGAR
jgi:hypothetical protein